MMLVGTGLISTLPHLTLRCEEMVGSSGRAQLTAEVRIGRAFFFFFKSTFNVLSLAIRHVPKVYYCNLDVS